MTSSKSYISKNNLTERVSIKLYESSLRYLAHGPSSDYSIKSSLIGVYTFANEYSKIQQVAIKQKTLVSDGFTCTV